MTTITTALTIAAREAVGAEAEAEAAGAAVAAERVVVAASGAVGMIETVAEGGGGIMGKRMGMERSILIQRRVSGWQRGEGEDFKYLAKPFMGKMPSYCKSHEHRS